MNKQKGFTFLELIIAIFLLTVGITGVYGMLSTMIRTSSYVSNQMVAAYLAQEGIELVRNIRDENWFYPSAGWSERFIESNCYEVSVVSAQNNGMTNCDPENLRNLYFGAVDPGGGVGSFYNYDVGGERTMYKRAVHTSVMGDGSYVEVTANVFWGDDDNVVTAKTILYNWR